MRALDMLTVDGLFIRGGYVVNFLDKTCAICFKEEIGVNIDGPRCSTEGSSKGKRLRYLLRPSDSRLAARSARSSRRPVQRKNGWLGGQWGSRRSLYEFPVNREFCREFRPNGTHSSLTAPKSVSNNRNLAPNSLSIETRKFAPWIREFQAPSSELAAGSPGAAVRPYEPDS